MHRRIVEQSLLPAPFAPGDRGENVGVIPRLYVDPAGAAHAAPPGHPERQARIDACLRALDDAGLEVERAVAPPAARADLERVHPPRYLDALEEHCRRGGGPIDADTYVDPESFAVAQRAAGACVEAAALAAGAGTRSFCLVRPPGHHATATRPMGFCLLGTAAVGTAAALAQGVERVAIVDFDVHHGNGTQEIFWRDPRVLYVSVHQWPWYPYYTGALEETGEGPADGTNVNIPLPAGSGDAAYLAATDRVVAPVVRAFRPGLLMVSAGYDAHTADPLSSTEVTTGGFAAMAGRLVALADETCGGRICMTLEGGYDLEGLSSSFVATMEVLAGRQPPPTHDLERLVPGDHAGMAVDEAEAFHAR
jgi:acetoin utilization deacetylase AcuC-like enzyme